MKILGQKKYVIKHAFFIVKLVFSLLSQDWVILINSNVLFLFLKDRCHCTRQFAHFQSTTTSFFYLILFKRVWICCKMIIFQDIFDIPPVPIRLGPGVQHETPVLDMNQNSKTSLSPLSQGISVTLRVILDNIHLVYLNTANWGRIFYGQELLSG